MDFLADLRWLSISCEFGEFLQQALRDCFVCGVPSESLQKRLLTEAELTIQRAQEISQNMESAERNARAHLTSSHLGPLRPSTPSLRRRSLSAASTAADDMMRSQSASSKTPLAVSVGWWGILHLFVVSRARLLDNQVKKLAGGLVGEERKPLSGWRWIPQCVKMPLPCLPSQETLPNPLYGGSGSQQQSCAVQVGHRGLDVCYVRSCVFTVVSRIQTSEAICQSQNVYGRVAGDFW